ncbi:Uu.00g105480.m01.CDS01 [Anthostomella pinea]|uniref:Uu.00g105480.m01.CDS01 n=1 Tax=Anthostomella pinea TaxID=933095 RepID=A0AAI8VEG3_9PEZI|nr:Uu.00g105480.m01.CDS01 [Anthostomella pinea]
MDSNQLGGTGASAPDNVAGTQRKVTGAGPSKQRRRGSGKPPGVPRTSKGKSTSSTKRKSTASTAKPRKKRNSNYTISMNKLTLRKSAHDKLASVFQLNNSMEASLTQESTPETRELDEKALGVAFMVRIERTLRKLEATPEDPEATQQRSIGGIVADEMGIEKTLQSLGCMMLVKPTKKEIATGKRTTLIVVPAGVLSQWKTEMATHTNIDPDGIATYNNNNNNMNLNSIKAQEVIFASYDQVMTDWKQEKKGNLFHLEFFRIISMRELQSLVANHFLLDHLAYKACKALKAKHKFILSGTPFQNSPKGKHPMKAPAYLAFLGIDLTEDLEIFKSKFGELGEKDTHHARVMKVLQRQMIRRDKGEFFMGRR